MEPTKPILNWVRNDNAHAVLTGGAVLAGKLVRLQARWPDWGIYNGPERFTIRTVRSRLQISRKVTDIVADVDGPPATHSLEAWQTGNINHFSQQRRYYFTDIHNSRSGELTVSNVPQYVTAPSFEVDGSLALPVLAGGSAPRLTVRGSRVKTVYHIGGISDPSVRVTLMVNSGDGSPDDLIPYLRRPRTSPRSRTEDLLFQPGQVQWRPAFENGERELILDVDEDHIGEVSVVPQQPYEERRIPFMTGFALRVENVDDPSQYVISDLVTVEGGGQRFARTLRPPYPEGSVLLRF